MFTDTISDFYDIALFCDFKFGEKFDFSNAIAIFSVFIQLLQGRKPLKTL